MDQISLKKNQVFAGISLIICLTISSKFKLEYYNYLLLVYCFQISSYYLNRDNNLYNNVFFRSIWRNLPVLYFISTIYNYIFSYKSMNFIFDIIIFLAIVLLMKIFQYILFGKILFIKLNAKYINIQPNYNKYWYLAYINDLFFSVISEEILRFLWLRQSFNYPISLMVLIAIFNFELQHTFDRYYVLNLKDILFRIALTLIQIFIFLKFESLLLMIIFHFFINSESIIFIIKMITKKLRS